MIEVAKISEKGQVTIPVELRKRLKLTKGSKVAFIEDADGRIYVVNSSMLALKSAQNAFAGVAEELGIGGENDVADFIRKARED